MLAVQPASSGRGNLVPVTGSYVLTHQEVLTQQRIPLYQVLRNKQGEYRAEAVAPTVAQALPERERERKQFLVDRRWREQLFERGDPMAARVEALRQKAPEERARAVSVLRSTLSELKAHDASPLEKAHAIMETVSETFLLNKASLQESADAVTQHERVIAKETTAIVTLAVESAEDPDLVSGLFTAFQGMSNGQTINHVTRVFAHYSGFLRYYQNLHQKRLVHAVRRAFPAYREAYRALLPQIDEALLVSDHLLQLPLMEPLEMREYALGAFLHDIGKIGNIDYFESDLAYDPGQIQQHVFVGAGLILMNYGNEHPGARILAGDHHNGLGQPSGYGLTRREREIQGGPRTAATRCLAGRSGGFVSGEALGWLPVEMLAVADVYDAMVDDSRAYKKPMTPSQATAFLEDTMVAQKKLDPVLVDLYIDYLRARGVEVSPDRGFAAKAARV